MLLGFLGFLCGVSASVPAFGQAAGDVRALLEARVGDLSLLQVPASHDDLPQPRLPSGEVDPRFAITPEKVRLGRLLFFDPIRSNHIRPEFGGDPSTSQTGSCGSCHLGEAASKAAAVVAVAVGGEGRHDMDRYGNMTITRRVRDDLTDIIPTGLEVLDAEGNVVLSGLFDPIDSPPRVSPSVIGFAFNTRLLWGGEAGGPNPEGFPAQEDIVRIASSVHRMANPDTSHLQSVPAYVHLFAEAFPEEAAAADASGDLGDLVSLDTQFRAIAAFLRSVITRDTPWDRFLAGDDGALTPRQLRGAWLFAAPAEEGGANCIACHSGPALNKVLGDEEGLLVEENFFNLGTMEHPLQDLAREALGNPDHHDIGRMGVTGDPADAYEFKTPTVRQAKDAAPYFHGGELATLREVVEYFNRGEPHNPLAAAAGNVSPLFTHPRGDGTQGLGLSEDDVGALVDFLAEGLYDTGFVRRVEGSPTEIFELDHWDLTYEQAMLDLGARDGWLPSGLPNGFNDPLSRTQIVFVRGEVSPGDDVIDISDPLLVFGYLFLGEKGPEPMIAADANDDALVDIADGVYLLSWLFRGGPEPPMPFPEPGQDLTK